MIKPITEHTDLTTSSVKDLNKELIDLKPNIHKAVENTKE